MEEATAPEAAPVPAKKGGGLKKLVVPVVALLVLGGGAGWFFMGRGSSTATAASEPDLESRGLLTFETLLVNLADNGGQRFLKATVQLVLELEGRSRSTSRNRRS